MYINISSFESSDKIQKTESGPYCAISDDKSSPVTLNKLAMNARRLYYNLINLSKGSLNKIIFISKVVHCQENGSRHNRHKTFKFS